MENAKDTDIGLDFYAHSKLDVIDALLKAKRESGEPDPVYRFRMVNGDHLKGIDGSSSGEDSKYILYHDPDLHLLLENPQSGQIWDTNGDASDVQIPEFYLFVLENIPDEWIFQKWDELFPDDANEEESDSVDNMEDGTVIITQTLAQLQKKYKDV